MMYSVKFIKNHRWCIYKGSQLVEGGFFSKEAAQDYLEKDYK